LLIYAPHHEDVRGSGGITRAFLIFAVEWGEWSLGRFSSGESPIG